MTTDVFSLIKKKYGSNNFVFLMKKALKCQRQEDQVLTTIHQKYHRNLEVAISIALWKEQEVCYRNRILQTLNHLNRFLVVFHQCQLQ